MGTKVDSVTKLINEPVQVHNSGMSPDTFIWRKRHYRILEVINRWRQPALWDNNAVYSFLRVNAANSSTGTYELCQIGEDWFLHRVVD